MGYMVTKARDREAMANKVVEILQGAADAIATRGEAYSPREVRVEFLHHGGLAVNIEFDGGDTLDRKGWFCCAWHINSNSDAQISDEFGIGQRANVNQFHHRKCTAFSEGFDDLCEMLRKAVAMLNDGSAYRATV